MNDSIEKSPLLTNAQMRALKKKKEKEFKYGLIAFLCSACFLTWAVTNRYSTEQAADPVGETSSPTEGMTDEQFNRYENLSLDGRKYVDEKMRQYDDYCAKSESC